MTVSLRVKEANVPMGVVNDVKEVLKNIWNVSL